MRYRLLAAEDEPQLRMMLWDYFTAKDFDVTTCRDGEEALAKLEEQAFDIVFLDIMMPKLDGLTVCRALRRENPVPVIFLTARSGEENELLGYGFGGDDYVTKPFSLPVLHAKALALIKRAKGRGLTARMLEMGGIQVDDLRREVSVDETPISLTPKEYELLVCLMEHRGWCFRASNCCAGYGAMPMTAISAPWTLISKNCVRHSADEPERSAR